MLIAPIDSKEVSKIVSEAYNDLGIINENKSSYDKLNVEKKDELNQLCFFLSFYICEALSKKVEPEIESLIHSIRITKDSSDLNDLHKNVLSNALANLRYLKGGGVTPGNRIASQDASKYIFNGANVLCRQKPTEKFSIDSWTPDYSKIRITNGVIAGEFPLSELIFVNNTKPVEKKESKS